MQGSHRIAQNEIRYGSGSAHIGAWKRAGAPQPSQRSPAPTTKRSSEARMDRWLGAPEDERFLRDRFLGLLKGSGPLCQPPPLQASAPFKAEAQGGWIG